MERKIGATDLRQNLTDIMREVREERMTYVVESFGRPQVAIVDLEQFRRFQQYQAQREAAFRRLDEIAAENARYNADLSEAELLALIDRARTEAAEEMTDKK